MFSAEALFSILQAPFLLKRITVTTLSQIEHLSPWLLSTSTDLPCGGQLILFLNSSIVLRILQTIVEERKKKKWRRWGDGEKKRDGGIENENEFYLFLS